VKQKVRGRLCFYCAGSKCATVRWWVRCPNTIDPVVCAPTSSAKDLSYQQARQIGAARVWKWYTVLKKQAPREIRLPNYSFHRPLWYHFILVHTILVHKKCPFMPPVCFYFLLFLLLSATIIFKQPRQCEEACARHGMYGHSGTRRTNWTNPIQSRTPTIRDQN